MFLHAVKNCKHQVSVFPREQRSLPSIDGISARRVSEYRPCAWFYCSCDTFGLLCSRSGRSHATRPVPTRLLQTDIHSFPFVLLFCLLGPMNVSFSCHCTRCTNHRRLCFLSRGNPCRHSTCYEKGWEKLLRIAAISVLFVHLSLSVKIGFIYMYLVGRPLI